MSEGAQFSIDEQALDWFVRLRDEPVGDACRAAFAKWRLADPAHAHAFDELSSLWSDLDSAGMPLEDAAHDTPVGDAVAGAKRRRHRSRAGTIAASLAACALTLGSYGALAPPGGVPALLADARTAPGQMEDLTLPDGTHVRLAGASALSYDISAQDRRVKLVAGRAFFDVHHERTRPFRVLAGLAEIRDIGTAFEVATAGHQSSVAVARGQVEVALDGGSAASLHAGQSVEFGKSLGPVSAIAPDDVAAWRSNRMIFDKARLKDVLSELQNYGAGRIVLLDSALGEKRLTGVFDTRRPRQALDAVAGITGAHVTWVGPVAFVRARGQS